MKQVIVTIIACGDNENTPEEAVHHGLEYARKAGFIEAWNDDAADRIEALEAALQQITALEDLPSSLSVAKSIARAALAEKAP